MELEKNKRYDDLDPFENSIEAMRQDYAQIRGVYAAAIREINARLQTL